jgi:hypothetical protein
MEQLNVPLPPEEFMRLVCVDRPGLETHFLETGREIVRLLKAFESLGPEVTFLDIGCGYGRIARTLLKEPLKAYLGFDRTIGALSIDA